MDESQEEEPKLTQNVMNDVKQVCECAANNVIRVYVRKTIYSSLMYEF